MEKIKLWQGDCLELMKNIPDKSIDLCLTDPPYGTTACAWDTAIDFEIMWKNIERIMKKNCAVLIFGTEPFSSFLRTSNKNQFKYDWYLQKNWVTGHLNCNRQPMRSVEICSVFSTNRYFPQGLTRIDKIKNRGVGAKTNRKCGTINLQKFTNYPKNLIPFIRDKKTFHPTQKPVELLEYLIKTYTLENETVLDFTMGSGSTGVAAKNLNRNFIGIELNENYFEIAKQRIGQ